MLLVTVATENEIRPLKPFFNTAEHADLFITGMGPVAAAANLGTYLGRHGTGISGVLNIGVAGAYVESAISVLDLCLARQEFLGDFGICSHDSIEYFDPGLTQTDAFVAFDNALLQEVVNTLHNQAINYRSTNFVTVSCCSGTTERGSFLHKRFNAGCENMEGAAVAMVCKLHDIPCVELRCVSNMVLDRNRENWQLEEAIAKICRTARIILHEHERSPFSHRG